MSKVQSEYNLAENYTEAFKWYNEKENITLDIDEYKKLAEEGDVSKQFTLGRLYFKDKIYEESFKWYKLAAEGGNLFAQFLIACMYWRGEGTIENNREAYIWFLISSARGYKDYRTVSMIDRCEKKIPSDDVENTKKEAHKRYSEMNEKSWNLLMNR